MVSFRYGDKIDVVYVDGVTDQVKPSLLDTLIGLKRVDRFERSGGWAEIGIDPIRGMGGPHYDGHDRRLS